MHKPTHQFTHCINTLAPKSPVLKDHPAFSDGCANIWYPSIRTMQNLTIHAKNKRVASGFTGNKDYRRAFQ